MTSYFLEVLSSNPAVTQGILDFKNKILGSCWPLQDQIKPLRWPIYEERGPRGHNTQFSLKSACLPHCWSNRNEINASVNLTIHTLSAITPQQNCVFVHEKKKTIFQQGRKSVSASKSHFWWLKPEDVLVSSPPFATCDKNTKNMQLTLRGGGTDSASGDTDGTLQWPLTEIYIKHGVHFCLWINKPSPSRHF